MPFDMPYGLKVNFMPISHTSWHPKIALLFSNLSIGFLMFPTLGTEKFAIFHEIHFFALSVVIGNQVQK